MNIELTALEARIIGCLIEKEITTPDYYPLSLNSLTTACNQKSNRDPVLALTEAEVQDAVEGLIARHLVSDESAFASRTRKYQHRFCNTEFGDLQLTQQELGIVCCMLLRGPQTPGELRTRTNRLCTFTDVKEVEAVLEHLAQDHTSGVLVVKLPREPGKRESRYQHLFCGEVDISAMEVTSQPTAVVNNDEVTALREEVAGLRAQVEALTLQVQQLLDQ